MTVLFWKEYNCRRYAVTFEKDGYVIIQNFKEVPDCEKNIWYVKPLRTVLGKSELCRLTEVSGAYDKKKDRNTILLKISD